MQLVIQNSVCFYIWKLKTGKYSAFRKYEQYEVDSFNSPFDIDSVMMYNAYSYAIRKKGPSMVDKDTGLPIEKVVIFKTIFLVSWGDS